MARLATSEFTRQHLVSPILTTLRGEAGPIIDIGCGPGDLCRMIHERLGCEIVGIDRNPRYLELASGAASAVSFVAHDLADELPPDLRNRFSIAVSTEVIEHLYSPNWVFHRATESGARRLILSTPYHGYVKNLVLAALNRMDDHWNSGRTGGHIKFFSAATLSELAATEGWTVRRVMRIGRVPPLAKSMIIDLERTTAT